MNIIACIISIVTCESDNRTIVDDIPENEININNIKKEERCLKVFMNS